MIQYNFKTTFTELSLLIIEQTDLRFHAKQTQTHVQKMKKNSDKI